MANQLSTDHSPASDSVPSAVPYYESHRDDPRWQALSGEYEETKRIQLILEMGFIEIAYSKREERVAAIARTLAEGALGSRLTPQEISTAASEAYAALIQIA